MTLGTHLELKASDILRMGPRYMGGNLLHQGLRWSSEDKAALAVVCAASAHPDDVAPILGREPQTIAHYANDLGLRLPKSWAKLVRANYVAKPRQPRVLLNYPYVVGPVRDDHALMLAVNAVVPQGLPGDLRSDVCQDMLMAVLEGELLAGDLRAKVPEYLKRARRRYAMPWGTVNIDEPLYADGRPLSEMLSINPLYE